METIKSYSIRIYIMFTENGIGLRYHFYLPNKAQRKVFKTGKLKIKHQVALYIINIIWWMQTQEINPYPSCLYNTNAHGTFYRVRIHICWLSHMYVAKGIQRFVSKVLVTFSKYVTSRDLFLYQGNNKEDHKMTKIVSHLKEAHEFAWDVLK